MIRLLLLALAVCLLPGAAEAGPVGAAISGALAAFKATAVGAFLTSTIVGRLLVSVGSSLLLQAISGKPKVAQPGIRTQVTQTGGQNPQAFILGRYATAGTMVCPPMSYGSVGDTPNIYLTYVVALSDIPGCSLNALIIDDQYAPITGTINAGLGNHVGGKFAGGFAYVKFYDGTQTAADPMLLNWYGAYPQRPWTADMIGRGTCYAIVTFRFFPEKFSGLPKVRFIVDGIPLYDPRKDTTVGGSGAHRWADRATWEWTTNPQVMAYNIMRGIELEDGSIYGGEFVAEDLPLANWFAAMNACEVQVDDGAGGTENAYQAGFEVLLSDEPADVLEELRKASAAQYADIGGTWKVRVGPPGLPVKAFTDSDIIISTPEDYAPFPGLDRTFNAIHASYPEPYQLWETKDAPPRYNATWEAEDQNRRHVAEIALPAVPFARQVQRVMYSYIEEERRFRRHGFTLPQDAMLLEPLDAVAWTSARNSYTDKVFEVHEITDDLVTCWQRLGLRERDPDDFDVPPGEVVAVSLAEAGTVEPAAQAVPQFAVAGINLLDDTGAVRGPAIELTWTPAEAEDVELLRWEVRPVGQAVLASGIAKVSDGRIVVSDSIVRARSYEARAELITSRATAWTAWTPATAPDVAAVVRDDINEGAVTKRTQAFFAGPYLRSELAVGSILQIIAMTDVPYARVTRRTISFEARNLSSSQGFRIESDITWAALGGPNRAWQLGYDVWDIPYVTPNGTGAYDVYGWAALPIGPFDSWFMRLRVAALPTDIGGSNGLIRNISLSFEEVLK